MRKPDCCICENKDADQLRGNREVDQRLCFRYSDSIIPLLSKSEIFKPLAILCDRTARFVSGLVGNPEDRFSQNEAHILFVSCLFFGLVISQFRFDDMILFLIVLVPGHCSSYFRFLFRGETRLCIVSYSDYLLMCTDH